MVRPLARRRRSSLPVGSDNIPGTEVFYILHQVGDKVQSDEGRQQMIMENLVAAPSVRGVNRADTAQFGEHNITADLVAQ